MLVTALSLGSCRAAAPEQPTASDHVVSGTLQGRTGAYLTMPDAASRIRVVTARLPGLLYRISTPAGSGLAPVVTGGAGRIRAALRPTGADGPDEVRVVLNREVRWDIRLPAGAGEQQLDLTRCRVTRLDLGASGMVELRLPQPSGVVPVTFLGPVGTAVLTVPASTEPTARDRYLIRGRSAVESLVLRRSGPEAR